MGDICYHHEEHNYIKGRHYPEVLKIIFYLGHKKKIGIFKNIYLMKGKKIESVKKISTVR